MKKLVVLLAVLIVVATAAASIRIVQKQRLAARTLSPVETIVKLDPQFVPEVWPGPKMRTFDLSTDVTLKKPDAAARVLFNFADAQNHHYVEIAPTSVRIVVMQDGVGRVLETAGGLKLAVGTPLHVTIKRRELAIRVVVDDVEVAEACDETFYAGKVGHASVKGAAEFTTPKLQAVAEIYFADDFMRAEKEKGPWTELRGNWRIYAVEHPSMSANAFQYEAQGPEEATVVAGYPFWDDYSYEVAVRPGRTSGAKSPPVGLYFYYHDENNYFRFDWYPEEKDNPGSGRKELVRMWHGQRTVVAKQSGGFRANQWYTMKCQAAGERVRTFIDDNPVFDYSDTHLVGGMVGLYAGADSRTYFDDVFVRSHRTFEDRFTGDSRTAWSYMGGDWLRVSLGSAAPAPTDNSPASTVAPAGILTVRTPKGEARAAVGSELWKDYVFETELHPDGAGSTGVLLYYQDETRYYQASRRNVGDGKEAWTLARVLDDKRTVLDEKTLPASDGTRVLRAGVKNGYISVRVDGKLVLEGMDLTLASGRCGLFAADVPQVSFGPVRVDWPLEEPPLLTLNEVFEHEDSMSDWSSVESDWTLTPANLWINKGNFPGDSAVAADVTNFNPASSDIGLLLSADGTTSDTGYLLRLRAGKDEDKALRLELLREGEAVQTVPVDSDTKVARFSFKRVGSFLVGSINHKPLLTWRDPAILPGDALGWYARKAKVDWKTLAVSSPNVRKYLFRKSPTDWRVVKGIWEVTNRWQCDPRWTFFSGRSSWQLAAIWYKRRMQGDATMDFYAGPKMDNERGNRYEYFADINCTIGGDGLDLTSGYSFLFGGFGNTKTVLMKGTKILAEGRWPADSRETAPRKGEPTYPKRAGDPAIIPSASINIHHTWFHVKAQKAGDRLRLWIDDELVIDYTDKDHPLTGDRMALWTWTNGIMVARVTVSADTIGDFESSDTYVPSHCRCVYDAQTVAGR